MQAAETIALNWFDMVDLHRYGASIIKCPRLDSERRSNPLPKMTVAIENPMVPAVLPMLSSVSQVMQHSITMPRV
jgi:hypothetical protein